MSSETLELEIRARIKQLEGELRLLRDVLAAGSNGGGGDGHPELYDPPGARAAAVAAVRDHAETFRPRKAKKAGGPRLGSRERDVLDTLEQNPEGLTIAQLAAAMDSSDKYLYRAMPRLLERGLVHTSSVPAGTKIEDRSELGSEPTWFLAPVVKS